MVKRTRRHTRSDSSYRINYGINVMLAIITVLALVALVIVWYTNNQKEDITNPLSNDVAEAAIVAELPKLQIESVGEPKLYNNIETHHFKFIDDAGNEIALNSGYIELTDIMNFVNPFLENVKYRVCSFGIVGSRMFIQLDTRDEVNIKYKLNIMTLKDNLTANDWIELSEVINNASIVHVDNLLSYKTDLGSTHYMYIYSNRDNSNVSHEINIQEESDDDTPLV